jgi:hypothetical protein
MWYRSCHRQHRARTQQNKHTSDARARTQDSRQSTEHLPRGHRHGRAVVEHLKAWSVQSITCAPVTPEVRPSRRTPAVRIPEIVSRASPPSWPWSRDISGAGGKEGIQLAERRVSREEGSKLSKERATLMMLSSSESPHPVGRCLFVGCCTQTSSWRRAGLPPRGPANGRFTCCAQLLEAAGAMGCVTTHHAVGRRAVDTKHRGKDARVAHRFCVLTMQRKRFFVRVRSSAGGEVWGDDLHLMQALSRSAQESPTQHRS